MTAKKIVFIAHDDKLYGSNRSLISILNEFTKYNYELHLIAPCGASLLKVNLSDKISTHYVEYEWSIFLKEQVKGKRIYIGKFIKKLKGYYRVIKKVKKIKPNLIYTNNSIVNHGIISSLLFNTPCIWHFRESVFQHNKVFNNLTYDFGYRIQKWLFKKANIRISNSNVLKLDYLCNFAIDSIVIYNGIINEFDIATIPKSIEKRRQINISIIGGISKNKGQHIAIEAFRLLNNKFVDAKLLIAGEGNYEELVVGENDNLKDKIEFFGFVENISLIYKRTDILLVCSQFESFGRTVVEAFSFGIPTISTKCGGPEEIIEDGKNGFFFDGSSLDLLKKIELLINPLTYLTFSQNALKKSKEFTIEKKVKEIDNQISILI